MTPFRKGSTIKDEKTGINPYQLKIMRAISEFVIVNFSSFILHPFSFLVVCEFSQN